MDASNELDERYAALVERISRYPMNEPTRTAILVELEAAYRRGRAAADDRCRRIIST
jgi:hypothetical protein